MEKTNVRYYPDPEKKTGLRGKQASSRNPGLNTELDGATMRAKNIPDKNQDESTKPSGESRRPITNHDEQKNIVNGDSNDALGEKESEGD